MINLRKVIEKRLIADLEIAEEIDIRSALVCGEKGCGPAEQEYITRYPSLRCPYLNRVDDPRMYCERLRKEYQTAFME